MYRGLPIQARLWRAFFFTLGLFTNPACNRETAAPAPQVAPGGQPAAATASSGQVAAITLGAPSAATAASATPPPPASSVAVADPETALPLFALPVSGGWRFPSRYHYHEWRQAVGLRRKHPDELQLANGTIAKLQVGRPAVPSVVILIDDLGNNASALRAISALPYPVNGAILPHSPLAQTASRAVRETGGDVLLHLPLEPLGFPGDDPGPGALFVTMPTGQRTAVFLRDWDSVPDRIGLNNHMGSRFTSHVTAMAGLASDVTQHHALFVDSRTVPRSHAHAQMVARGIPSLGRTHFLDEVASVGAVEAQLAAAIAHAQTHGFALAIGHPNTATIKVLREAPTRFQKAGVQAVSLRALFQTALAKP